jgi:hypothetical protein
MRNNSGLWIALAVGTLGACVGEAGDELGSTAAAGTRAQAGASRGAASTLPLQIKITARATPSNGEDHVCVVLPLQNTERAWIRSVHASLTAGSHHLIVDRMPVGTATQSEPTHCEPTMGRDSTRLIVAQQRETVVHMPTGTGLLIEPHQPVFMQLHYINLGSTPADIEGVLEITLADSAVAPPLEVHSLFTGSKSLSIPRGQSVMAEFFMKPAGSTAKPWHVFAITSHTHALAVKSTIERVESASAAATPPIHESLDWREPALTALVPELVFDGSDGVRLRCHYVNTTDRDVSYGTRFEDEMCFLWLYYY